MTQDKRPQDCHKDYTHYCSTVALYDYKISVSIASMNKQVCRYTYTYTALHIHIFLCISILLVASYTLVNFVKTVKTLVVCLLWLSYIEVRIDEDEGSSALSAPVSVS